MPSVQIKRKRGQDPLDALMVRNKGEETLFFKLAGTFEQAVPDGEANFTLQETSERRVFKRRKGESKGAGAGDATVTLAPQLKELVSEYISSVDPETEDYVYDIYFGSKGTAELASGAIGYIVLDEEDRLVFDYESEESEAYTADEDSNAEDFYQNDYPDEESEFESLDDFDDLHLSDHFSPESD